MSLDDDLMGPEPDWTAQPEPLRDELEVDRYLRRYQAIADQIHAANRLAAMRVEEINAWRKHEETRLTHRLDWLAQSIEGWGRAMRDEKAKRLSFSLPSGTIKTTRVPGRFRVTDDAEFIAWAKEHRPSLVRWTAPTPKEVPDTTALKALMPAPGLTAPGLVYDAEFIRVTIQPRPPLDSGWAFANEDDSENDSQPE